MKLNRPWLYLLLLLVLPFLIFWENFLSGQLVMTSDSNIATFIVQHERLCQGWEAHWSNSWWLGLPAGLPLLRLENVLIWLLPPVVYAKVSIPLFLAIGGLSAFALGRAFGFADFVALVFALGWELVGSSLTDIPGGHHSRQLMLGVLPLMYLGLWQASKSRPVCGVVLASVVVATMIGALADSGAILALSGVCFFIWLNHRSLGMVRFWAQSALGTIVTLLLCGQIFFSLIPGATSGLRADDLGAPMGESPENKWDWHAQWSFAPEEVFELVAPGFFGWQTGYPDQPYWGRVGQTEGWEKTHLGFRDFRIDNPTTGTAVAALALLGIWGCWRRRTADSGNDIRDRQAGLARFFIVMAMASFLLSLGKFLPGYRLIFEHVPGFQAWRNPNKFFFVTSFCIVFLAGFGAQVMVDAMTGSTGAGGRRQARKAARGLWFVSAGLAAGSVLVLVYQNDLVLQFSEHFRTQSEAVRIVWGMFGSLLRAAFFWGCWGGLVVAALRFSESRPARLLWIGLAWVALSVAEMVFVASHYLSFFKYQDVLATHPMLQRVIEDQKHEVSRFKMIVTDPLLNSFYFFQIPYHRIQSIDIPASSLPSDDYRYYFEQMQSYQVLMWELGNVRYVLAQSAIAGQLAAMYGSNRFEWVTDFAMENGPDGDHITEVSENAPGSAYRLLQIRHPLPRALVVPEMRIAKNPDDLFALMKSGRIDFEKTVLALPSSGLAASKAGTAPKNFGAQVCEYSDNRIMIEAHSDQPAYLLLNDKYDPDWRATVNGQPARIFRANFIVRGVAIPAGRAEVVFTYHLDRGLLIFTTWAWSLVLLFGCLFCVFAGRKRSGKGMNRTG